MKKILFIPLAVLTLAACQNIEQDEALKTTLFSHEDIRTQVFLIPVDRDTVLSGNDGTLLTIHKNTFTDTNGNQVTGSVKIELKECLSKVDMVLGNMTTTSKGRFLESGGMVYINATSNNQQLLIANDKSIGVQMPADSILSDMQLFEGVMTDNGIDWQNPVPIKNVANEPAIVPIDSLIREEDIIKRSNVGFFVRNYHYSGSYKKATFLSEFRQIPPDLGQRISEICWQGNGLILTKDSIIHIDTFEVALVKMDSIREFQWANFSFDGPAIQGQNQFREDTNTNYIFSVKKLGWANIDRLFSDPRTMETELIVTVENHGEFENIYTSMIFKNQNMYLPGYQKKDNTFSFTHGDYENPSLPVGETAIILVTAYKDNKPFYAIKTFTILEAQTIDLKLTATTKDDLKNELEKEF